MELVAAMIGFVMAAQFGVLGVVLLLIGYGLVRGTLALVIRVVGDPDMVYDIKSPSWAQKTSQL